jgi:hypothetical protein
VKKLVEAHKKKEEAAKSRALEIFMQLMQLKPFKKWFEKNIIIRDEVDHLKKQINTYVVYKGDLPEEEQKRFEVLRRSQYDWWCETCDQGFGSHPFGPDEDEHKPVCAQCGSILITIEKPLDVEFPDKSKEGGEGEQPA